MRTQLVTIPTDTLPLEGAFHEPDGAKAAGAVASWLAQTLGLAKVKSWDTEDTEEENRN